METSTNKFKDDITRRVAGGGWRKKWSQWGLSRISISVHLGKFLSTWKCFAKDEYASIGAYAPYVHSIVNEASPGGSGCPVMGGGWCRPKPKLTQHAMLDTKTQEFPTTESLLPVMLRTWSEGTRIRGIGHEYASLALVLVLVVCTIHCLEIA